MGRGVWRGEVFVEESAAGEQSSGTQVTGKEGSPSVGSSRQRSRPGNHPGWEWEGGSRENLKGAGQKGPPEPCRHQRSSIWHQGSPDPAEGSATREVSSLGSQRESHLPHIRSRDPS